MAIEAVYRKYGEGALANYDYIDIADGLGYTAFHGFTAQTSGAMNYYLSNQVLETGDASGSILSENHGQRSWLLANAGSGAGLSFSTSPFNLPRLVKGKAFVNFSLTAVTFYVPLKLTPYVGIYKNSTLLASTSGAYFNSSVGASKTYSIALNLPSTNIKRGDVLTLIVSGSALTNDVYVYLNHDPINRSLPTHTYTGGAVFPGIVSSENPTELNCCIPFKVDI